VPIGAYATVAGGVVELTGIVGTPDGSVLLKETASGSDPGELGRRVADMLSKQGADRILAEARG